MLRISGKASRRAFSWLLRSGALVLCSTLLFGCRENSTSVAPQGQSAQRFAFGVGDHAVYDNWKLNGFGYIIPGSRFRDTWTTIDTAAQRAGRFPVSIVVDSVFAGTSAVPDSLSRIDTLFFSTSPEGDVFQYGYLAALLKRREGKVVKPQWDRIAGFSLGLSGFWTVGPSETQDSVYGTLSSTPAYIAVDLNGMQTALLAYSINLSAPALDITLWLSDSPSAIVLERDESTDVILGMMKEMIALSRKSP